MIPLDLAKHKTLWTIRKFEKDGDYEAWLRGEAKPYEVVEIEGNVLLNEGIAELHNLAFGTGGTKWDNTNAYLGVGTSATAESATDTGLIAASLYKGMETSYPTYATQVTTWRAVFGSAEANVSWQEFSVSNTSGGDTGVNLNRKTSDQGTKTAGQTWTLDLQITWS